MATPVPFSVTTWGVPALSVMMTLAVRAPLALGVKMAEMLQDAWTASDAGHVLEGVKSPEFVPPGVMLVMVSAAPPVFVRLTDCGKELDPMLVDGKVRVVAENVAMGPAPTTPVMAGD